MSDVIEVKNLVKTYRKAAFNAVDDVSFTVKKGEFFTLLGPNGAGKTTTISILNTTLAKTSGEIRVAGYDIDVQPSKVRREIGVIFQNPSLDLNLSAEENIRFHAILYGLFSYRPTYEFMDRRYKKKVAELSEILGIQDRIHEPIKTFSGGMKRKLEIIRGLIHDPAVLFLDEPTTGLDPESRRNLWKYIDQVRRDQGITVFLTTHYLDEAESADRVCIINHGKIEFLNTPEKLKRKFVTEYVIVDAEDREKLFKELKRHKLAIEGEGPFTITSDKHSSQDIICSITTKLSLLKVHAPTLEEAYLELIKNNNHDEKS